MGKLLKTGIEVCIGTDGAASNNNLDLLAEVQTAALLAKQEQSDATCLNAWRALEMLTLSPARALGLESSLGSLEAGKAADIVALDLDDPCTQPLHNVASQLVYAAHSRQFSHLWVAGRMLLENGRLCTLDWAGIAAEAENWRQRLRPWAEAGGRRPKGMVAE